MQPLRPTLDVSGLPDSAMDARSPVWWGNLLLICIESTTMVLLLAAYFYIRRNFWGWPPPRIDTQPPIFDPSPDWIPGTINMVILAGSCWLMYVTDMAARRHERRTPWLLLAMFAIAAATSAIRFWEFHGTHFRWNDNAYASIVWVIMGTHLIYLLGTGAEFLITALWSFTHPIDNKHALDITLIGGYWYWACAIWLPTYIILYWYPHWS